MQETACLSSLLGSRICHDLISPIGAIGNGVELMMLSEQLSSPELALIAESVASANARIRFYRVAFGEAGPQQRLGRPEIQSLLGDLFKGSRLSLSWSVPGDVPRREAKLAFLLLMCLEYSMPFGGEIAVEFDAAGWRMTGIATRWRIDHDQWALAQNGGSGYRPGAAEIQFALVPHQLAELNRKLKVDIAPERLSLSC